MWKKKCCTSNIEHRACNIGIFVVLFSAFENVEKIG